MSRTIIALIIVGLLSMPIECLASKEHTVYIDDLSDLPDDTQEPLSLKSVYTWAINNPIRSGISMFAASLMIVCAYNGFFKSARQVVTDTVNESTAIMVYQIRKKIGYLKK